jgi:peptidoglycan/LPS O-acetylase OafA/YrhL
MFSISLRDTARNLGCCLIPSYVQQRYGLAEKTPPKLHPTSALDGLRGIAALFVFFFHIAFSFVSWNEYGYGRSEADHRIFQLPFVRLFYSGHAMVSVFFVVGGYVLSIRSFKLIQSRQTTALYNSLVSSVFRRTIRLYAPAIIATFLSMLSLYAGLWEYPRTYLANGRDIIKEPDHHIEPQPTFKLQLLHWLHQTFLFTNIFGYWHKGIMWPYYHNYDPHLWAIIVEYRSSLILFLVILALSRCKTPARIVLMSLAVLFCIAWDRWEMVCFLSGSLLCQIDLVTNTLEPSPRRPSFSFHRESKSMHIKSRETLPTYELDSPPSSSSHSPSSSSSSSSTLLHPISPLSHHPPSPHPSPARRTKLHLTIFTAGLYLLSMPSADPSHALGYNLTSHLVPATYDDPKRFPSTIGALLVIFALMRSPTLRAPLESRFAQYLGSVSFSLYLVHGPLIHVVGFSVVPATWRYVTGAESAWRWGLGLAVGSAVLALVVAVVTDWFWRVVEARCVGWAARFERVCFVLDGEE